MNGGCLGTARSRAGVDAFPDDRGSIPDNPLIEAGIAALFHGGSQARSLSGGWRGDEAGRPAYRHVGVAGDEIVVSLDPAATAAGERHPNLVQQWVCVEDISPLTIDVLLAVLARLCVRADGGTSRVAPGDTVTVTARAILRDKGLEQWGAEGAALRARVDRELLRLQALRFEVRARASAARAGVDRLFEIAGSLPADFRRAGRSRRREVAWVIRPGRWAGELAYTEVAAPLAVLPRRILQFDHRANRGSAVLAKKLAVKLALVWGRPQRAGPLHLRVCDLLAEVGELPQRERRGGGWGARMRQRLARAVHLLKMYGLLGPVAWPTGIDADRGAHARGWVASWLSGTIVLDGPAAFGEGDAAAAQLRESHRRAQTASKLAELHRGSVIRALRTNHNIPQSRLAEEIGISAAYLSQIENEHRMASPAVLGRIAGWARRQHAAERTGVAGDGAIAEIARFGDIWPGADGAQRIIGGAFLKKTRIGRPAGKDDRS